MKQPDISLILSTLRTRKEVFLDEINLVVSWRRLLSLIAPSAPRVKTKGTPFELVTMLRIYLLQKRFGLSCLTIKEALLEPGLYCEFTGLLNVGRIFDNVSIRRIRHLLKNTSWAFRC